MAYQPPTADQALAFAKLLFAGIPAFDALSIVEPALDPLVIPDAAKRWERDAAVRSALVLFKGDWLMLTKEDRAKLGVEKTYNAMAFFLWTHNYGELETAKRAKADACLAALEKMLAGTAGQGDPLSKFWEQAVAKLKPAKEVVQ